MELLHSFFKKVPSQSHGMQLHTFLFKGRLADLLKPCNVYVIWAMDLLGAIGLTY